MADFMIKSNILFLKRGIMELRENEVIDDLEFEGLKLIQNKT